MVPTGFVHSASLPRSSLFSRWVGAFLFLVFSQGAFATGAVAMEPDKKGAGAEKAVSANPGDAGDEDVLRDLLDLRSNADSGDVSAQFELSRRYLKGDGLEQNDEEALRWLRLAAEGGLPRAQAGMGWMYGSGRGVKKDESLSFSWYERAAVAGFPVAQWMLGHYYELGIGVARDRQLAKEWYEKAAAQNNEKARKRLQEWK